MVNLDNIIKQSSRSKSSDSSQPVSLPDGVVHAHDFPLISSSIVVNGGHQTVLKYLDGNRDRENPIAKEVNHIPSNGINSLFDLQNASLSLQRVVMDMSSESANQDVRCAVLASSTIFISFCEFFWTDLKSLFVLRSGSPSEQASSSVTLAWCSLKNSVGHLMPIVEDMRKDITAGAIDLNMVGTRIDNMKVVGPDGVGVSQTNHHNDLSSFEGISTTVSELRILNVSSLPKEVKEVSSLFSQRMVGCGIWGSNNHLSGSVLRDVNGGGSFLCSNSTFDWCHTTSSERPSIVRSTSQTIDNHSTIRKISNQAEPGDDPNDPYTGKLYDDSSRFITRDVPITFTRCQFTNMKYTATSVSEILAGGSAIFLNYSTNPASIISCSFSKCSVTSTFAVYGGCVYMYYMRTSTITIDACSFDDWYPTNDANTKQSGGGIGAHSTSAPLQITNTNFTLSGDTTNKNNGGFFASLSGFTTQSSTLANCRFIGESKTTGRVMHLDSTSSQYQPSTTLTVTDSQILNTNSQLEINSITFESSSGFTRTEITNTSIQYSSKTSSTRPFLFVDCKLDNSSVNSMGLMMFLISGTSFTGKPIDTSKSYIHLQSSSHVVIHNCDFTDCSPSASKYLIYSYIARSLVLDICSFTRCTGGSSIVYVEKAYAFLYFCIFADVTDTNSSVITLYANHANFFESCRFNLGETKNVDVYIPTIQFTYLNDTAVIGCTSNRQMYFGTYSDRKELTAVQIVNPKAEKNEMRVGTWPTEPGDPQPIPLFSSLSEALSALTNPTLDSVITVSTGNFTEATLLSVSKIIEIVGAGSKIDDRHSTQLTTNGFVSKLNGELALRSLRLVPSSISSVVASTEDDGSLCVLDVIVEDVTDHSVHLFRFATGSSEIRHSSFKTINSTESLIFVSQTASLTITNTLFLSIMRTRPNPTPYDTTQCASCIEGKTSGRVKVIYCRFGACTTNGRAGAIDLVKNDVNSAVEMSSCWFDQNSAGEEVPDDERGDDVVLKSFAEPNTLLDFSAIYSFPSPSSFLIDLSHPIVPPPALLIMTTTGVDDPLTWSYTYGEITKSLFEKHSLQFLLEHRFRNNTKTELKTDSGYSTTMTPFIFQNSTVFVNLKNNSASIITVDQQGEVFITLQTASLSFEQVQFVFGQLTTSAFTCDKDSSIELVNTVLKLTTPTLTHPYVDSFGPSVIFKSQGFLQNITLDRTPFVRLNRAEKDAEFVYQGVAPLLASPLTAPFIVCEGAKYIMMQTLTLNYSFVNSASFVYAKASSFNSYGNHLMLLKSTAKGAFLHIEDGTVHFQQDKYNSSSDEQGGLLYCHNSTITSKYQISSSCSAKQGGVFFSQESSVNMNGGTFSNCEADEGGIAYLFSSSLLIESTTLVSNSAKRGGVFFIDFGNDSPSSVISKNTVCYTNNTAHDEDESGVDSGKGGAIFVTGTTTSVKPLALSGSYFEGNTATFGNDVFVEEEVLGETGPDLLSECGGESYSRFPHLEIENHDGDDELLAISDYLPFPTVRISSIGSDAQTCKWSKVDCKTLVYALPFLQSEYSDGRPFQRKCVQVYDAMTTEPIEFQRHDVLYLSSSSDSNYVFSLPLSAAHNDKEAVVFTITGESRLTAVRIRFLLKSLHQVVKVTSKEGRLAMQHCVVLSESGTTTSTSPIWCVGSSLVLNTVSFSPTLTTSIATLSVPLVHFTPTPSVKGELRNGTCDITGCTLTNLTFSKTTLFEIETSGRVSFVLQSITRVTTDLEQGKYISLKGRSFKQQIQPSLWHSNPTTSDLPFYVGEDVSMDQKDKWRNNSLVYWLMSPKEEVKIGSDDNAVDHPNCGSSTFQCTTLDSAFKSGGLNDLSTLTLSTSTSLSTKLSVTSLWVIKSSSSATKQGIKFDQNGSIEVASSEANLSFASIIFTVAETCQSATLFVVEEGELSFSSCVIGSEDSSSPHVLPASTTTLIEVKTAGNLILTDTLIQHIKFSHATLGTAIRLHLGSTTSSSGTKPISNISSNTVGRHAQIVVSTNPDENSLSALSELLKTWGPTLTDSPRYSKDEINEFATIDEDGNVNELIYSWYSYDGTTMYLHSEGGSHAKCGVSALPCSSLSASLEKVDNGETIILCSALTETANFVATKDLSVKSSDNKKQIISVSSSTTFTTQDSNLTFADLSFVPLPSTSSQNAEPLERADSLFLVESGLIELTGCSLSSFVIDNKPLHRYERQ
ncbi:hypothetical protein BLNAU_20070 [Blattamonas nauphoetae]|uniref:Uncharacterized protein n=1 Tax=Blattamonas nauphoetae TaxID=2049346 RepID=A0ABQ9WZQ0_9EUKA|nr:hypothetical protein BLNAU_20070 [Blattamonas nauphoetae]